MNIDVTKYGPVGQFMLQHPALVIIILIWSLIWKGTALWKSARLSHMWWFLILLIVNTVGILEIIYIFAVAKKHRDSVQM